MTLANRGHALAVVAASLCIALGLGCETQSDGEGATLAADTTRFYQPIEASETGGQLEEESQELEARVQRLLSLIEEREKALNEHELELEQRAAELDQLEADLRTQRMISLAVLGLGALAIIIGISVGIRQRQPTVPAARDKHRVGVPSATDSGPRPHAAKSEPAPTRRKTKAKPKAKASRTATPEAAPDAVEDKDEKTEKKNE